MSESFENIYHQLAILDDSPSEEDLLEAIRNRVVWFLENDVELLMSYLYRLDIAESKINAVLRLENGLDVDNALALLILERQKQRLETRKKYHQESMEDWDY